MASKFEKVLTSRKFLGVTTGIAGMAVCALMIGISVNGLINNEAAAAEPAPSPSASTLTLNPKPPTVENVLASVAAEIRSAKTGSAVSLDGAAESDVEVELARYTSATDFCLVGTSGETTVSYAVDQVVESCA